MNPDEVIWTIAIFTASACGGAIKYQVNGTKESRKKYLFLVLYSGMVGFGMVTVIDYVVEDLPLKTCLGFSTVVGLFGPEQLVIVNSVAKGFKAVVDALVKRTVDMINPSKGNKHVK